MISLMQSPGPPVWMPQERGWYTDPWNSDYRRWFDGQQWTPATERATLPGRPILGPLLILAGIVTAVYLAFTHVSVHVPIAGDTDCGATSWRLGTANVSDFSDSGSSELTDALDQECINGGRSNLYKGGGALVVGLIAGGMVTAYERHRKV